MATRSSLRKTKPAADAASAIAAVDQPPASDGAEAAPVKKPRRAATRKPKVEAPTAAEAVAVVEAIEPETITPEAGAATPVSLSEEERQRRIAEVAYFIAERRGFAPGNEADDWAQAEAEVERMLNP